MRAGNRDRSPTGIVAVGLAFVGLGFIAQGLWIPVKAWAAERLIARAWDATVDPGDRVRPWAWADTWPIARLTLPGARRPLYVLAGASGQSLAFGPAHVSSSALPGSPDNVVLAGHRDTHFAPLEAIGIGAEIHVETRRGSIRYRVDATGIVHESRVDLLERSGRSELTLITCYPFDTIVPGGPLRFVVFASAIDESASVESDPVD